VPGSAKIAADINQAVANNARRFLFHHPSDDPLAGLALPQPRPRELSSPEAAAALASNTWSQITGRARTPGAAAGAGPLATSADGTASAARAAAPAMSWNMPQVMRPDLKRRCRPPQARLSLGAPFPVKRAARPRRTRSPATSAISARCGRCINPQWRT
jgi:hypothetical protein